MAFRRLKRVICVAAIATAVGVSAALSGCTIETKHPRAQVTIEFNGQTYVLEYTLYRNMYPQTVRHFIELVEQGFYNNTVIHNYTSSDWYGGGYAYDEENYAAAYETASMDEYFNDDDYYLEDDYISLFNSGVLTPSVYTNYGYDSKGNMTVSAEDAYYTLIGEFSANDHTIENGQRAAELGSLKMFYTEKVIEDTARAHVYIKTSNNEILEHDYKYNCATSLFAIQVSSSSSLSSSSYCTFAYLRSDDDVDTLNELLDAIADYIDDEYNGEDSEFTTSVEDVVVDRNESIPGVGQATSVTYTATAQPIIIKSVKITKY